MAEQLASSAVSGVGEVSQRMHYAQSVAKTAISEARITRKTVEEEMAQIRARADASASTVAHELSNKIDQVAAGAEQIASRVIGDTSRQLESGLRAVTTSTAATAEITARTAIEGVRQEMQSQFDHEREANRLQAADMKRQMNEISTELQKLTQQLIAFKPVSEHAVWEKGRQITAGYDEQFAVQTAKIETLANAVSKADKSATETSKSMQDLVIGVENLGEHFKAMQEKLDAEIQKREQATLNALLAEAPLPNTAAENPARPAPISTLGFPDPTPSSPTMHVSEPSVIDLYSVPISQESSQETSRLTDEQTQDMEARFNAIRGNSIPSASVSNAPIPVQFIPSRQMDQAQHPKFFSMGTSQPVHFSNPEGSHRRITPIPISIGQDKSSLIAYGAEGKLRQFTPEEMKEGNIQNFRRICGMNNVEDEPPHVMNEDAVNESSEQTSGSHGPTIGDTTISTNEEQAIGEEVRTIVREQMAAGRQMLRASLGLHNEALQSIDAYG